MRHVLPEPPPDRKQYKECPGCKAHLSSLARRCSQCKTDVSEVAVAVELGDPETRDKQVIRVVIAFMIAALVGLGVAIYYSMRDDDPHRSPAPPTRSKPSAQPWESNM